MAQWFDVTSLFIKLDSSLVELCIARIPPWIPNDYRNLPIRDDFTYQSIVIRKYCKTIEYWNMHIWEWFSWSIICLMTRLLLNIHVITEWFMTDTQNRSYLNSILALIILCYCYKGKKISPMYCESKKINWKIFHDESYLAILIQTPNKKSRLSSFQNFWSCPWWQD